ncbi:uncharacterized protein LOC114799095 [Denticeps clupeoides]|uniref:uncharacterized protein LOC114799095 n=1 Tax=Denticeps clupeoides TaxID=299321 RepID=UPI0010A3FE03|nr:uncharacterized protein LOC114799095 [Denticeps clupeoides]
MQSIAASKCEIKRCSSHLQKMTNLHRCIKAPWDVLIDRSLLVTEEEGQTATSRSRPMYPPTVNHWLRPVCTFLCLVSLSNARDCNFQHLVQLVRYETQSVFKELSNAFKLKPDSSFEYPYLEPVNQPDSKGERVNRTLCGLKYYGDALDVVQQITEDLGLESKNLTTLVERVNMLQHCAAKHFGRNCTSIPLKPSRPISEYEQKLWTVSLLHKADEFLNSLSQVLKRKLIFQHPGKLSAVL